jgi:hypothetical protein
MQFSQPMSRNCHWPFCTFTLVFILWRTGCNGRLRGGGLQVGAFILRSMLLQTLCNVLVASATFGIFDIVTLGYLVYPYSHCSKGWWSELLKASHKAIADLCLRHSTSACLLSMSSLGQTHLSLCFWWPFHSILFSNQLLLQQCPQKQTWGCFQWKPLSP